MIVESKQTYTYSHQGRNRREDQCNPSCTPSITDGVHRNENFVEIIPVFSIFSNFFQKKKIYKCHFM